MKESVNIGFGPRRVRGSAGGVSADVVEEGPVKHQDPQVRRPLHRRETAKKFGGDPNDINEVFAGVGTALQVAEDDRVIREVLALPNLALAGLNAIASDA